MTVCSRWAAPLSRGGLAGSDASLLHASLLHASLLHASRLHASLLHASLLHASLLHSQGVTLGDRLLNLETDVYSLFNYQFQVMPYNYLNLISSVTTLYLVSYAFHKGLGCLPGTLLINSLIFPLANVVILTTACVGLMMVGGRTHSRTRTRTLARTCTCQRRHPHLTTRTAGRHMHMHMHTHMHM